MCCCPSHQLQLLQALQNRGERRKSGTSGDAAAGGLKFPEAQPRTQPQPRLARGAEKIVIWHSDSCCEHGVSGLLFVYCRIHLFLGPTSLRAWYARFHPNIYICIYTTSDLAARRVSQGNYMAHGRFWFAALFSLNCPALEMPMPFAVPLRGGSGDELILYAFVATSKEPLQIKSQCNGWTRHVISF